MPPPPKHRKDSPRQGNNKTAAKESDSLKMDCGNELRTSKNLYKPTHIHQRHQNQLLQTGVGLGLTLVCKGYIRNFYRQKLVAEDPMGAQY